MNISDLIKNHNRKLILKMVLNVIAAIIFYCLAYLFFRYISSFVCDRFRLDVDEQWFSLFAIAVLIVMTVTHVVSWKKSGNTSDMNASFLAMGFHESTVGAVVVNSYTERVTGPAYAISYLFYQGPAALTRVYEHHQTRIPHTTEVVNRVSLVRDSLRSANKWQDSSLYVNQALEIIYLALMEEVDLDLVKGRVKYSG